MSSSRQMFLSKCSFCMRIRLVRAILHLTMACLSQPYLQPSFPYRIRLCTDRWSSSTMLLLHTLAEISNNSVGFSVSSVSNSHLPTLTLHHGSKSKGEITLILIICSIASNYYSLMWCNCTRLRSETVTGNHYFNLQSYIGYLCYQSGLYSISMFIFVL